MPKIIDRDLLIITIGSLFLMIFSLYEITEGRLNIGFRGVYPVTFGLGVIYSSICLWWVCDDIKWYIRERNNA